MGVERVCVVFAGGTVAGFVEEGAVGVEGDGGFDGEVCLVGCCAGPVVGGELGGNVDAVCDEVVGVAAEPMEISGVSVDRCSLVELATVLRSPWISFTP